MIVSNNGTERTSSAGLAWRGRVELHYMTTCNSTENAFVESLNGQMRDELLDEMLFISIAHARARIAAWADDHNNQRPHSSLG